MFSYWIARNLPMSAEEKMQILLEDNVDYRLLLERLFIKKSSSFGCLCGSEMIMIGDLINLNSEGISCCYVNSHGYVHDLITAKAINNVKFTGHAETEYSWFPGYSWKIMNCSNCNVHVGWKFQSNKLKPAKFYGISRSSIQAVRRKEEQI
jgi:cereblon